MKTIINLLLATRPKTLFASAAPVLVGFSIAVACHHYSIPYFLLTLLCALLLQVGSNLINDYADGIDGVDQKERLGPQRMTAEKLLAPKTILTAFIITMLLALLLGIFLMIRGGLPIVIIGFSSIIAAYLYSRGPKPLSRIALGEAMAFIFYGPVAVWGTFYLQTKVSSTLPLFFGVLLGFFSATIMAINNLRDRDQDIAAKKITVATLLTLKRARLFTLTLFFSPYLLLTTYMGIYHQPYYLLPLLSLFIFRNELTIIATLPLSKRFNQTLAKCGQTLFLFSMLLSLSICLTRNSF